MQSTTNSSHANKPTAVGTESIPQTHTGNDTHKNHAASEVQSNSQSHSHATPAQDAGVQDTAPEAEGRKRSISFIDVVPARTTNNATKKKATTFTFDIGLFNSPSALRDLIEDVNAVHKDGQ